MKRRLSALLTPYDQHEEQQPTMSSTTIPWLSIDQNGHMHAMKKVPNTSPQQHTKHIVTILGAARQGKSFLINLLSKAAGGSILFQVSDSSTRCTQGVDLYWPSHGHTAFADVEGQGDRPIDYDTRLVTPTLLLSRCILFNWKGGVERDHIMTKLGVLTKAAELVISSTTHFGHLHIVFRDWTHSDKDPERIKRDLFSADTRARNILRSAFASISIWLLPPPVVDILKIKPTPHNLRPEFQSAVAALHQTLERQLRDSHDGYTFDRLRALSMRYVEALNSSGCIVPQSAYDSVIAAEVQAAASRAENEARHAIQTATTMPQVDAVLAQIAELPGEECDAKRKAIAALYDVLTPLAQRKKEELANAQALDQLVHNQIDFQRFESTLQGDTKALFLDRGRAQMQHTKLHAENERLRAQAAAAQAQVAAAHAQAAAAKAQAADAHRARIRAEHVAAPQVTHTKRRQRANTKLTLNQVREEQRRKIAEHTETVIQQHAKKRRTMGGAGDHHDFDDDGI